MPPTGQPPRKPRSDAPAPASGDDKRRIEELTRRLREQAENNPEKFAKLVTEWLKQPARKPKNPTSPHYHRRKLG